MIEVDSQINMIMANINDKMRSITQECLKDEAYAGYIDEKLKSIEWDIRVLRNRVDKALKEEENENNQTEYF